MQLKHLFLIKCESLADSLNKELALSGRIKIQYIFPFYLLSDFGVDWVTVARDTVHAWVIIGA